MKVVYVALFLGGVLSVDGCWSI